MHGAADVIHRTINYTSAGWTEYLGTRWAPGAQARWTKVKSSYEELEREVARLESLSSDRDAAVVAELRKLLTDNDRQVSYEEGAALEVSLPAAVEQARGLIRAIEVQRQLEAHNEKLRGTRGAVTGFLKSSGADGAAFAGLLAELDTMFVAPDALRGEGASARNESSTEQLARSAAIEREIRRAAQKSILESVDATYTRLASETGLLLQRGNLSKEAASNPRKQKAKYVKAKLADPDGLLDAAELKGIAADCASIAEAYDQAREIADRAGAAEREREAEAAESAKQAAELQDALEAEEAELKRALGAKYGSNLPALEKLATREQLAELVVLTDGGTLMACLPFAPTKLKDLLALTSGDHLKRLLPELGKDQEDELVALLGRVGAGGEDTLRQLLGATSAGNASTLHDILLLFAPGVASAQLALSVMDLPLTRKKEADVLALLRMVQVGAAPLTAVEVGPLPVLLAKLRPTELNFCLGPDGGQTIATLTSQLITNGAKVWTGATQNAEPTYFPDGTTWADITTNTCPTQNPVPGRYCTRPFGNAEGSGTMLLPKVTGAGVAVAYTEWDIKPYDGPDRGVLRVVTDNRGRRYYTSDHYKTFYRFL